MAGRTAGSVPSRSAGEAGSFANGKGGRLYTAYQERLKTLNAADFGDLLLECLRLWREHPDIWRSTRSASATCWWTSIRTPTSRSILAAAARPGSPKPLLRRRRRPVDLRLARRRGRQHPAVRTRFSGATVDPAGAQLPLHRAYPVGGVRPDRQEPEPPRQDPAHGG